VIEHLPDPLVPADVDLRDFGFMPLEVLRLRDSDLTALASGEEFKAAVLLWCVAWHQVPAASLPNDDRLLARYSGGGSGWKKVKEAALRGFTACNDGRLYHSTIAEKALEAWSAKAAQRARTKAATEAREAKRRAALAQRDEARHEERDDQRDEQRDVERNVDQGIGIGTGIGKEEARASSPPEKPEQPATSAGLACKAMRQAGLAATNPGDPRLIALCDQGATLAEFEGIAAEAVKGQKGFAWVLTVLVARRAEAAKLRLAPAEPERPWHESAGGIKAKGEELGIPYTRADECRLFESYKERVFRAAGMEPPT
jgi:hypothetical protein